MGMYDSVCGKCPACGTEVDFQSKAGKCLLREYNIGSVPVDIASDIDGDEITCHFCGETLRATTKPAVEDGCITMRIEAMSDGR